MKEKKENSESKLMLLNHQLNEVCLTVNSLCVELDTEGKALAIATAELEERFKGRTKALEETLEAANLANEAKSDFLAEMSHEIRTPMNGMVGMIELLLNSATSEQQVRKCMVARDSAHALLKIINEILDLSKIESGRLELEVVPFNLAHLIYDASIMYLSTAESKGIQILCFVDPQIMADVVGDGFRIRQILQNLIANAIKFISTNDGRVTIRVNRVGPGENDCFWTSFEVSDNGIGIKEDQLEIIFHKFTQADISTTRHYGGTGLGLAICKALVHLMDGHIEVTSVLDKGSTFTVTLPLKSSTGERENHGDLTGVNIIIALSDAQLREDLACYARFWKADTTVLNSVEDLKASTPIDDATIIVYDQKDAATVEQLLEDQPNKSSLSLIEMCSDQSLNYGIVAKNMIRVANYPVHRSFFIQAIAISAGKESPEIPLPLPQTTPILGRHKPKQDEAQQQGRLILVAEDNPQNKMVLEMQLETLGYAADFVEDGQKALAAWSTGKYGLLITDCHMPIMNGYQLAQKIREQEQSLDKRVPIIALTANAMLSEERRCLDMGMDVYLVKPISLVKLDKTLQYWLPVRVEQPAQPVALPAPPISTTEMNDVKSLELFNANALVEYVGHQPAHQRDLLENLVISMDKTLIELHQAFLAQDLDGIVNLAHKVKSSFKCCGAFRLSHLCLRMEQAGNAKDHPQMGALIALYEQTHALLKEAINQHLAS